MIIEIDFSSDEAIYIQLCNQIIMGIATDQLKVGETLPSVRQLADTIGINMHTVNKASGRPSGSRGRNSRPDAYRSRRDRGKAVPAD